MPKTLTDICEIFTLISIEVIDVVPATPDADPV